jgi:aminodeoxyfutalosine deaminase
MPFPKIELHVHFEGTIAPATLLELAHKNDVSLPADTVEGIAELYRFDGFDNFVETWLLTTQVTRTPDDFRRVVIDYAAEAARHGCVYIEGIFSPAQPVRRGSSWQEVFEGYCDGAQEAHERHGVEVRLTPDLTRGATPEEIDLAVEYALAYVDRGVVGIGLGGYEAQYPPELYAEPFRKAREGGLGSVPHAGEAAGPESIRGALDALGAVRLRHGIRAVEDPALVRELADRRIVLDTCLASNICTGVVRSLEQHPLPQLVAAGVPCTLSTDDPAMFDTDLEREYANAARLGLDPRAFYEAALEGALCDEATRERLRAAGAAYDWPPVSSASASRAETAPS